MEKKPEFVPASRGPSNIERQDFQGTPPTDAGVQSVVEKQVEDSSGLP